MSFNFLALSSYVYACVIRNGYLRSLLRGVPLDRHGRPLPWITYPAIEFLNQLDLVNVTVLEVGSGYSTAWLSTRCKSVLSLETSSLWIDKVSSLVRKHGVSDVVSLRCVSIPDYPADSRKKSEFCRDVNQRFKRCLDTLLSDQNAPFGLVFIDGWGFNRGLVAQAIVDDKLLDSGGIVLVDDSKQCPLACDLLRQNGFVQFPFVGFSPGGVIKETSVFVDGKLSIGFSEKKRILSAFRHEPANVWDECF